MNYRKLFISTMLVVVIAVACTSTSSQTSSHKAVPKQPKHHTDTGYQNHPLVVTAAAKGVMFYLRRAWHSVFVPDIPAGHQLTAAEANQMLHAIDGDRLTWLGHASFLMKTAGVTILTDPFLSKFASPVSWAGPRRFVDLPIAVDKLPPIDILIISHNHYDHLDDATIRQLPNKHHIQVVVPLGLKSFFSERGYRQVTALDWGQSITVNGLTITAESAVHYSARTTRDRNQTLWASWVIESPQQRLLFIGDSGYSASIFKQIGAKYRAFDLAIVPIGAYQPRELLWMSHVTPEEAVAVGRDVGATTLVASHWGTISSLSDEPMFEPPLRFRQAGRDQGFSDRQLWTMKIGETRAISAPTP